MSEEDREGKPEKMAGTSRVMPRKVHGSCGS